jgi:hypothetical protein
LRFPIGDFCVLYALNDCLLMKKLTIFLLIISSCIILSYYSSCSFKREEDKADKVSFNFQVRPILSDKCFNCHGPDANKRQAGLRLDIESEAYKALKEHPRAHALVPGDPDASELFLRISSTDTAIRMPPPSSNIPPMTEEEIAIIKKWIKQGAKYEPHWAFIAPVKTAVPSVKNKDWIKNEIDHFIFQKLQQKNLTPNKEADKERLLKRLSLDLTGLLPTIEETEAFLNDRSEDAYEKQVDRLLSQPAYGERMALPWLDVARYADSHGYQDDNYRSQWPWRDWVIHAFNKNMSYDQFVTWQLAGDLIPDSSKESILATGFNRNHKITEEGGVIDEEYKVEYVTDRTNTFGRAFIGVTVECAKCHDHKFDPISQREFFQLYAFFNNIKEPGLESVVGGPETYAKNPRMEIKKEDLEGILSFINKPDTNKLEVSVMRDNDTINRTCVLTRGEYDKPAEEVMAATPVSVLKYPDHLPKNRLGLSKWLFDPAHPLTARVFVNRMWQEFFGRGIVKSAADFGMQGALPSHPELLDWLAVDFRENGWNIKRLVKQLVMSATYRQSASVTEDKLKADPENIYLSHAPRLRMPAEIVRDIVLSGSGLLNRTIGGPSVKPYQPPGLWEMATSGRGQLSSYRQDHGDKLYRRGMYTFIKRTVPPPSMMIFDASNRDECEVKRTRTNTPLQALVMLNDPLVLEASLALADNLIRQKTTDAEKLTTAFRRIVCRKPLEKETAILSEALQTNKTYFQSHPDAAEKVIDVGEYDVKNTGSPVRLAALMMVVQTIFNMDESLSKT